MFDINFKVHPDFDELIDERGNTAVYFRMVDWNDREAKRPEIRKWRISENGETPDKGVTFLTDDGPKNLAKAIIKKGFGETAEYIEALKDRDDFDDSLAQVIGKKKVNEAKNTEVEVGDYYDPKVVFNNSSVSKRGE